MMQMTIFEMFNMGLVGPETIRICRKLRTGTQISLGLIILIGTWCEALSVLEKMDVGQFQKFTGTQRTALTSVYQSLHIDTNSDQVSLRLDGNICPTGDRASAHDAHDHLWKC